MKPNMTFEILFLILIGNLNQHVAGQSSLSLDLHKQSQRSKQRLPAWSSGHGINSAARPPALRRLKRHSASVSERAARKLDSNSADSPTSTRNSPIELLHFEDSTIGALDPAAATTGAPQAASGEQRGLSGEISSAQTTSQPRASSHAVPSSRPTTTTTKTTAAAPATKSSTNSTWSQPNYELSLADLCYLTNGGSSLTLTVNEATQVGTQIGTIDVNGEPALEGGNVELELEVAGGEQGQQADHSNRFMQTSSSGAQAVPGSARQIRRLLGRRHTEAGLESADSAQRAAIKLERGTRHLVLARPLDKESAEGETGLWFNVRCRPRPAPRAKSSRQPAASIIPVRLIVTDANDHAPQFLGQQPYVINISETTPAGSPVGSARDIQALDRDAAGPHSTILYHVLEQSGAALATDAPARQRLDALANLSQHFAFSNPLEPVLWLTSPLDYDSLPAPSFTITIVAQDQAEPEPLHSEARVQINVLDFDDQNPRFLDEKYSLVMDELQSSLVGQPLRVLPRQMEAEDGDRGIGAPILYSFDSHTANTFLASTRLLDAFGSTGDATTGNLVTSSDDELPLNIDSYLHLNPASGELRLLRQWPRHKWAAGAGALTLVVRAAQADNRDRYALTTLTITPRAAALNSTHPLEASRPSGARADQRRHSAIAFPRDQIFVQVAESAPLNERLVQVRAEFLDELARSPLEEQPGEAAAKGTGRPAVGLAEGANETGRATGPSRPGDRRPERRPISYQLLDDHMDQFRINELGEIFLKRPLDFEQRQEFWLRVLASYTKHSDICRVHLAVANVNDNKPKFTHSQYSFQLTESRLRSNLVGAVQAHDADLNDTLEYSILSGLQSGAQEQQCARLFEFANPASGQLSLKMGIRQLNVSQCQLLVQASDTLGPSGGRHRQQARVSINVSPQIIGRSISVFGATAATTAAHQTGHHSQQSRRPADQRPKQTGADSPAELSTASSVLLHYQPSGGAAPTSGQANQRSSLATVMASLQHMARGMNLLEMPVSLALLLSVLLAFLVCLLLIVVVSMSVHVYRRRAKTRRRRHLAATAHLRHAHLAAAARAARGPMSPYKTSSSSYASNSTTSASPGAHSSASSVHSGRLQPAAPAEATAANPTDSNIESRRQNFFANLGASSAAGQMATRHPKPNSTVGSSEDEPNGNTNDTSLTTAGSAQANGSPTPATGHATDSPPHISKANREPLEELKISTELGPVEAKAKPAAGTYLKSSTVTPARLYSKSLVSSLTTTASASQSNPNSYLAANSLLSTDEDDSSVIQCGHYSVNNTIEHRQHQADDGHKQLASRTGLGQGEQPAKDLEPSRKSNTNRLLNEIHTELMKQQKQMVETPNGPNRTKKKKTKKRRQQQEQQQEQQASSSIEAAIRSLARQEQALEEQEDDEHEDWCPAPRAANKFKMLNCEDANEVCQLTSAGKPGIRSYRQLPLMNSLVRPVRSQLLSLADRNKVAPDEARDRQIRWPSDAAPQRIKRLTWDDELSCGADTDSLERHASQPGELEAGADCYISPALQLAGPMSPLALAHQFSAARPLEYLYSPSSQQNVPRPNYSNYLPLLNAGQTQEQTSVANVHNRNNCLDYTIVQTSQFHADSLLASAGAMASTMANNRRQSNEPGDYLNSNHERGPSEHYYYEQTTLRSQPAGSQSRNQTPTRESSQTGATYNSNQNYQDLKLMTTAVL